MQQQKYTCDYVKPEEEEGGSIEKQDTTLRSQGILIGGIRAYRQYIYVYIYNPNVCSHRQWLVEDEP